MTDLPIPNLPLLRKTIDWATEEAAKPYAESLWRQSDWARQRFCGTAFCLAGKVVTDHYADQEGARLVELGSRGRPGAGDVLVLEVDGTAVDWHDEGRDLLGLTSGEAYDLFDSSNDIARVREVAERIAERAGETL